MCLKENINLRQKEQKIQFSFGKIDCACALFHLKVLLKFLGTLTFKATFPGAWKNECEEFLLLHLMRCLQFHYLFKLIASLQ